MKTQSQNNFGNRLKLARKYAGLSMQELADALNNKVSKQALGKYELGLMNPSSDVLLSISKALNLKPDYFTKKKQVELGEVLFRKVASLPKKTEESIIERVREYI
jgi:transcriptional regulator with XRE-family HTH domain